MKNYTDIEQSHKLAKILPLNTADMCYKCLGEDPYDVCLRPYSEWKEEYKGLLVNKEVDVIPCWSLAALLNVLPPIEGFRPIIDLDINLIRYEGNYRDELCFNENNLIDACYEMILRLHELKML